MKKVTKLQLLSCFLAFNVVAADTQEQSEEQQNVSMVFAFDSFLPVTPMNECFTVSMQILGDAPLVDQQMEPEQAALVQDLLLGRILKFAVAIEGLSASAAQTPCEDIEQLSILFDHVVCLYQRLVHYENETDIGYSMLGKAQKTLQDLLQR